jgi:hypothetical protein
MTIETTVATDPWTVAQQRCWSHVEVATNMTKTLDALRTLSVTAVIPIISDSRPTLMITPESADEVNNVRATMRVVSKNLQETGLIGNVAKWEKHSIGDTWVLRLTTEAGIIIDLMTRISAVKEAPIEV